MTWAFVRSSAVAVFALNRQIEGKLIQLLL